MSSFVTKWISHNIILGPGGDIISEKNKLPGTRTCMKRVTTEKMAVTLVPSKEIGNLIQCAICLGLEMCSEHSTPTPSLQEYRCYQIAKVERISDLFVIQFVHQKVFVILLSRFQNRQLLNFISRHGSTIFQVRYEKYP